MDNLNDPYCREFIEAMAAILVQQVQQMPDEQPVLAVMPAYPIRVVSVSSNEPALSGLVIPGGAA